jgi:hypothetical protein
MSPRPLKVFLCHAHADRDPVRGLYTRLTQDGVDAWLDKAKLLPGQDWELEIRKAVREADVVVVCLSKQFNQAGFRQKEVRLALDTAMEKPEGEIFIIPARLEECEALESLRKWHWVDLFEEDGYEMLMRALCARAEKIGATLLLPSTIISKQDNNEMRIFYDLASHYEDDIQGASAEVVAKYLLESLTRIMSLVIFADKQDNDITVEYKTISVEYFDPKEGRSLQHALLIHGAKLTLVGKGQPKIVKSSVNIQEMLIITITQGVNRTRIRFDSEQIPRNVFDIFVEMTMRDLVGSDYHLPKPL